MKKGSFGERLAKGLRDAIAYESGEDVKVRVYEVEVPDAPPVYTPQGVQRIREQVLHLSQAAFARLLHVSPKTVQGWEQGIRRPAHSAARLLQFIESPHLLTERIAAGFRRSTVGRARKAAAGSAPAGTNRA